MRVLASSRFSLGALVLDVRQVALAHAASVPVALRKVKFWTAIETTRQVRLNLACCSCAWSAEAMPERARGSDDACEAVS